MVKNFKNVNEAFKSEELFTCSDVQVQVETSTMFSVDEDGNAHGFTASRSDGDSYISYSYYSSDELSHEDIQKMLKAFGF